MKKNILLIKNLHVFVSSENSKDKKEILKGVNLGMSSGEIHAIMGPNGAGKTTLAMSLMGKPNYKFKIQNSKFKINGKNIFKLSPEERARAGLFVSFQQPLEITGVSFLSFLRTAYKAIYPNDKVSLSDFKGRVRNAFKSVGLQEVFMQRSINEGFSGGEKKRSEIVQLLILKPRFAILDEIDSGLDIESIKLTAGLIRKVVRENKTGVLVVTHYNRILTYLKPDLVHVLIDGKIKTTGNLSLVETIEKKGYAAV